MSLVRSCVHSLFHSFLRHRQF